VEKITDFQLKDGLFKTLSNQKLNPGQQTKLEKLIGIIKIVSVDL
jgi:hypothetical protein